MLYRINILLVMGILLIYACNNTDANLETKKIKNSVMTDTNETELQDKKDHWILSTDSIWKLRVYPIVGHVGNITTEPMRFICAEVQLVDTNKHIENLMPSILGMGMAYSPSYLALHIYNDEYDVYSSLKLIQKDYVHIEKSLQFAFSFHSLDNLANDVKITLGHLGYYTLYELPNDYPHGYPIFQVTDLHNLIMPFDTILYDKNAPLADESWFKKKDLKEFLPKKREK